MAQGQPHAGAAAGPTVSVIVPTHARPEGVLRAVRAAADQTRPPLEIIVVGDDDVAPDEHVFDGSAGTTKLRLLHTGGGAGASRARNLGVSAATGDLVAFCDDDDEWHRTKLEVQVDALGGGRSLVMGGARLEPGGESAPGRAPAENERLADYLFSGELVSRRRPLVQTSTFLMPRDLAEEIPFQAELVAHQDWDVALRVEAAGAGIVYVDAPLVTLRRSTSSISNSTQWADSLAWAQHRRDLLGEHAFSSFCLGHCARLAAQARSLTATRQVVAAAMSGAWTPLQLARVPLYWVMSAEARSMLRRGRALIGRRRGLDRTP